VSWRDNWDAKYVTSSIKIALDNRRPAMLASVSERLDELQSLSDLFRGVLASHGINKLFFSAYWAACEKMYAGKRKWPGGDTLDMEMAEIISTFTTRGLTADVLETVAAECFGWIAPTP